MDPAPINPYANVKPPPPVRPGYLEEERVRPPPTQVIDPIAKSGDVDRSRDSRGSHNQEDLGKQGSGKRGDLGGRYVRSDWLPRKSSRPDWSDHKSSWSTRGWSETRRYRDEGRRK